MSEPSRPLSPIFIGDSSAFGGPREPSPLYTNSLCLSALHPLFWWCNDAFAWVGVVLQAWVVTPSLWHLEAGGLMRVLRQETQQLQKETDVLKPDRTECRHHHHCVRVPSSYLVSLPTPSEVLPSAQNGPDISVFGYKMQHWVWAPVQHYALNAMGFLLS